MAKVSNYIFVDEAGDPGAPFLLGPLGEQVPTGASPFYIISALCVDEKALYLLENRMMEVKSSFGYLKEIKSNEISLPLYEALLNIVNELDIKIYYCLVDKAVYQGKFKVDGIKELHNVFDEYNLVKAVACAIIDLDLKDIEVVIDRTDRRLLDGRFESFNNYLLKKVRKYFGEKEADRINHITHVNSVYVNAMQMSDIVGGAIRDNFTGKNTDLIKALSENNLIRATGKRNKSLPIGL
jgi:hypothetical protein